MKYTVTNNSNAPHDLLTLNGRVVVLAGGSVGVEFDDGSAGVYGAVPFFDVQPIMFQPKSAARDPLDHDGDGRKGGFINSATYAENNEPIRRKPGRPAKNP